MQSSDIPDRFTLPFASAAGASYVTYPIPEAPGAPGIASLEEGFPPITFDPLGSGGIPPSGKDFNGILKQITLWNQWQAAGGPIFYNTAFATAISGYPKGAVLSSSVTVGLLWINTVEGNATNPDSGGSNWQAFFRVRLLADTTFYISPTGNNSTGNGTNGAPWQTLQYALDTIKSAYDFNSKTVTIQMADGTYGADATVTGGYVGQIGPNQLRIQGNIATPANVQYNGRIEANGQGAAFTPQYFKMGGSYGLVASGQGSVTLGSGMNLGAMASYQFYSNSGGYINISDSYTISGGASAHMGLLTGGQIVIGGGNTITLTGTPGFGSFVVADGQSRLSATGASPYTGAATGTRYTVTALSLVDTNGGGANFFPGNSAGIVDAATFAVYK